MKQTPKGAYACPNNCGYEWHWAGNKCPAEKAGNAKSPVDTVSMATPPIQSNRDLEEEWDEWLEEIDPDIYDIYALFDEWSLDPTDEKALELIGTRRIKRPKKEIALVPKMENYDDYTGLYDDDGSRFPSDFPEDFDASVDVPYRIEVEQTRGGWWITRSIDGVTVPNWATGGTRPWEETYEYQDMPLGQVLALETRRAYDGEWGVEEDLVMEMQDRLANPHRQDDDF